MSLDGQAIGTNLTELASSTASELESIWEIVGYSADEKHRQLESLLNDFKEMCSSKIAEEMGAVFWLRGSIESAKEEMISTSSALKIDFDRSILTKEGENLTETLSGFEVSAKP